MLRAAGGERSGSSIGPADPVDERDEEALRPQAGAHLGSGGGQLRRGLVDHGLDEPTGFVEVGDVEEDRAEDDPDSGREAVEAWSAAACGADDLFVVEVAGAQRDFEPPRDEDVFDARADLVAVALRLDQGRVGKRWVGRGGKRRRGDDVRQGEVVDDARARPEGPGEVGGEREGASRPPGGAETERGREFQAHCVAPVDVGDAAAALWKVGPLLVQADFSAERRLEDRPEVDLLDRRPDPAQVHVPAPQAVVGIDYSRPGEVGCCCSFQALGVAVEPAVDGDSGPERAGDPPARADGKNVQAAARVPGRPHRFLARGPRPHRCERPAERYRTLEARLDRPREPVEAQRPSQGGEVYAPPLEAVRIEVGFGTRLCLVERAGTRERDLRDPEVAEARGVPGSGGGVVGPSEEGPSHPESSRPGAEGQAGAPGEVDPVLLQELLGGLGGGRPDAAHDDGQGEPRRSPAERKRGEGGTTRRCPSHRGSRAYHGVPEACSAVRNTGTAGLLAYDGARASGVAAWRDPPPPPEPGLLLRGRRGGGPAPRRRPAAAARLLSRQYRR